MRPAALAENNSAFCATHTRSSQALLTDSLPPRSLEMQLTQLQKTGHGGRSDYDAVHAAAAAAVRAIARANDCSQSMHILESALRLRQLCVAPVRS